MKKTAIPHLFFIAVITFPPISAFSQKQTDTNSDQPLKLGIDLVVLDAYVLNKRTGRAVGSLNRDDFTIYENGIRQQITHFSQDVLPLSVIILIDTSSSVWRFISQIREGAFQALEHLKPDDEIAIMATAAHTELVQDFTRNKRLVAERIKTLDEKALGDDGILLHEAIYQAAAHFRKASNPDGRRAIIAITDDMSTQRLASQGHSEKEAFDELYESGITVCGLLVGYHNLFKAKWYDPIGAVVNRSYRKKYFGPGSIRKYAEDTGGVVIVVDKGDVSAKLTEIIIQLRSRYSFGYVSSNPRMDGKFRKINLAVSNKIKRREGGIAILTRKGYYTRAGK
jgi:VWFA-related protein